MVAKKSNCVNSGGDPNRKNFETQWKINVPAHVKPGNWVLRWSMVAHDTKPSQHFENCAYIRIEDRAADVKPSPKPTEPPAEVNPAYWGEFKKDNCSAVGKRQYSAILWNINGSWEEACKKTPATINGKRFSSPARCKKTASNMWGEFDVPDSSCT